MSIASEITRLQGAKADLATAIEGKGVTVPSATKLDGYADLVDAISQGGGGGTMQSKSVSYTPSTSAQSQTVTPDTGYDGLSSVAVSVAAMPSGTEGTPVATKGAVSSNSVTITPSVTNSAGYIEGGTKTGEAVTVSASDVTSGYQIKTANGTYDVTNLASLIVTVPNTYTASDEGKVVSNGALVAQTSDTVTTNDTYDTTLINSLTVNVSGGGKYKSGTITPSTDWNTTTNHQITTLTDIGFTPKVMILRPTSLTDISNINYAVGYTLVDTTFGIKLFGRHQSVSTTLGFNNKVEAWTTQANAYLYLDGSGTIYYRTVASTAILLQDVEYTWEAFG